MKKDKKINIRRILVIAFLVMFSIVTYISFRGSYLEYKELGENFLQAFLTRKKYQYIITLINFVAIFFIMYISGRNIKKGLKVFFEQEKKDIPKLPNKSIALVVSIIESIIVGKLFTPNIILCMSNVGVGETDPIFNLDISFFMFIEPILKMMATYLIGIFVAVIIYSVGYYIIVFNRHFNGIDKETLKNSHITKTIYRNIRIITLIIAIFIMICSMDIVFDNFLTTDNNIRLTGAGFVDSTIKYWGYIILALVLVFAVFKAIKSFKSSKGTKILKDLAIVPIYMVALFIVMIAFDFIFVRPNEFDREKDFINANINATKKAYAIDCNIESLDYSGTVTVDEVDKNQSIIDNAVIVDKKTVLDYLEDNQKGTGYYTYKTAKLSSYNIDGNKKLVYVSPREIVSSRRTYNSKTYEYTHGYGLIFTSATEYLEDGKIKYIQNDISGNDAIINISKPQIYYGLETNNLVVTNANNKTEFDYADDEAEYETSYNGNAGLSLGFIDRLILGMKQGNINLALSNSITKDSKVLINRNILKRAKLALEDIFYDENPYTVVDENGDIYWIIDGYTISSSYPYSTYTEIAYNNQKEGINYIRNSVKVIINCYTGEMKYYITDRTDPIAMAYRKVYPQLFQNIDESIPQSIQEQFIYPEFLYKVQSTLLEEYHNTKADVLYRSDDTWEKLTYKNASTLSKASNTTSSYYTMVKQNEKELIGLIQFYSPKNKQSIKSYLIGTVENGQNKLTLKTLHSSTSILGPNQLDSQISQDEVISKEIENLTVTGAKVTKNMIIVPLENTFLYIQPIYQTLVNESNLPVLKKVVVASGNKVAIGNNLQEAVENLISTYATSIDTETNEDIDSLIDSIIKANGNLKDSLSSSNWELMGSDIKRLQELIDTLEKEVKENRKDNTTINNTVQNTIDNENVIESDN